jgi:hypothetical protein
MRRGASSKAEIFWPRRIKYQCRCRHSPGAHILSAWQADLLLGSITAALPGGSSLGVLISGIKPGRWSSDIQRCMRLSLMDGNER